MNNLQKKKLKRNLNKAKILILPTIILTSAITVFAAGYVLVAPNQLKGDYYFGKAQEMDDENPYGSREALKYYKDAINQYEAIGNKKSLVNAYIDLGLLHHKFGNITQVEASILKAMEIGGHDIPQQMKAKAYMLLAGTVEPEKAKEYIKQAIYISGELDQRVMTIKGFYILAKIYEYKADFESAKKLYLKAIQYSQMLEPEDGFFDPEPLYSDLAELYAGEGSTATAIKYYNLAMESSKGSAGHGLAVANYMKIMGDLYKESMQMTKACQNWNNSKEEYEIIGRRPPIAIMQLSMSNTCRNIIS